jgi:hypothetical protein
MRRCRGARVELHMDFANGPVPQPKIFTTGNPPRIAVDFADTDNAARAPSGYRQGLDSGVSAVAAGGRTRVVVELMRESTYRSRVEGTACAHHQQRHCGSVRHHGGHHRSVQGAAFVDEWSGDLQHRFPPWPEW